MTYIYWLIPSCLAVSLFVAMTFYAGKCWALRSKLREVRILICAAEGIEEERGITKFEQAEILQAIECVVREKL